MVADRHSVAKIDSFLCPHEYCERNYTFSV